jgi:uracil-DNA glycosylase
LTTAARKDTKKKGRNEMREDVKEIVEDVKLYLEYLKEMGVEGLPVQEEEKKRVGNNQIPPQSGGRPKTGALDEIRTDLGECKRCKLHRTRKNIVFGEGAPTAKLMFVGEGPGFDEDVQGRPFVGRAGQLLTKIIESIHLKREEVYIANILKCRPPQNRNPEPDEIQACHGFVLAQIEAIRPKVICALGTFAAQTLLQTDAKISTLRGRFHTRKGIKVMPTYHPAYLLRNPERKKDVWEDMKQIAEELKKA